MAQRTLAGRYELVRALGRGGMGQVWEAVDRQLGRRVAVKLLTGDTLVKRVEPQDIVRRFLREAAVTAGLQHPGVPGVHDAGTDGGDLFMVMELVEGLTVGDLIAEQGPLPIGWATGIAAQIAAVLAVAHERQLVHRDIKPQNLMVSADGTVKVLDFGVAAVLDQDAIHRITRTGESVGTPAYMSPEQLRGERATSRADLYGLGCVLYEMLSGEPVFAATTPLVLMHQHLEQPPAPLNRGDLPADLETLVRRLLAKEAADRPASAREVFDGLLPYVGRAHPLGEVNPSAGPPSGMHLYSRVLTRLTGQSAAVPPPAAVPVGGGLPPTRHDGAPYVSHRMAGPTSGMPTPFGGYETPSPPTGKVRHHLWMLPALVGLAWMSFLYVAIKHQRRLWIVAAVAYFLVPLAGLILIGTSPTDAHGTATGPRSDFGVALVLLGWPVGIVHAVLVNRGRRRLVVSPR